MNCASLFKMIFCREKYLLQSLKNKRISATRKETRRRCEIQTCKQYQLKVDVSHLSDQTLAHLRRLFFEAKWFYNHVLANGNLFQADYGVSLTNVKVGDHFEMREITQSFFANETGNRPKNARQCKVAFQTKEQRTQNWAAQIQD